MKMADAGIYQEVQNVQIQCSCCGTRKNFKYSVVAVLSKVVDAGWSSFGHALYCPKCSETWEERNGSGRPLASRENTIAVIDAIHRREGKEDG